MVGKRVGAACGGAARAGAEAACFCLFGAAPWLGVNAVFVEASMLGGALRLGRGLPAQLGAAVQDWLAPLRAEPRPLSEWCAPVRAVLEGIYGAREFDSSRPEDRLVQAGLRGISGVLTVMAELPAAAGGARTRPRRAVNV